MRQITPLMGIGSGAWLVIPNNYCIGSIEIMISNDEIVRGRQSGIRRELDRRGIALKLVAHDSSIPYPTLLTYFPQEGGAKPVMLPTSALYALAASDAIPLDLLSLLLPGGFLIVRAPEAIDHDDIEAACRDYLAAKGAAHRADSPGGTALAECEIVTLNGKAARLKVAA